MSMVVAIFHITTGGSSAARGSARASRSRGRHERLIFETALAQRNLVDSARKTTRTRRNNERRQHLQRSTIATQASSDSAQAKELEGEIPSYAEHDDFLVKVPALKELLCRGGFRHRWSLTPQSQLFKFAPEPLWASATLSSLRTGRHFLW
jgi:hypothetical protein